MMVWAHFIEEGGGVFSKAAIEHVPRAGDEVRFKGDKYFRVTRVVWCLDEKDAARERVNIGIVRAA